MWGKKKCICMRIKIIVILLLFMFTFIPLNEISGDPNDNYIDYDVKPINLYLSNEDDEYWDSKFLKIETPNSTIDSSEYISNVPVPYLLYKVGNWSVWSYLWIIIEGQFGFEFWVEASISLNVEFMVRLYEYDGEMKTIAEITTDSINVIGIQKIEASIEIGYVKVAGRLGVEVFARANYDNCNLLYDSVEHDSHITIDCDPFHISIPEPKINTDNEIVEIQMDIDDALKHLDECDYQLSIIGPVEGFSISNYTTEREHQVANTIYWNWDYKKDFAIDGNYTIIVEVIDYNGNLREYNTKYYLDFPHEQIPDLWITEITFSSNKVTEGDILNVSATVWNIGYIDVKSTLIEFYDDSNLLKTLDLTTVEVNSYKNISVTWFASNAGKHTIKIIIDPKNEIAEVDESNNIISQGITISTYENNPPIIYDTLAEPSKVDLGGSSKITVDAYDKDNDDLIYTYKISSGTILGEGNIVTWIAPEIVGLYKIKVTVTDSFDDEDYDDISISVEKVNVPPTIKTTSVTPNRVKNDGNSKVLITGEVDDGNGMNDINTVKIDLTSIGGSRNQQMYDDGSHGDLVSNDGIFSYEIIISSDVLEGNKEMTIMVTDYSYSEASETITFEIEKVSSESEKGVPGFEGFLLSIIILFYIFTKNRKRN